MTDTATYPVPGHFDDAHITAERYQSLYQQSLDQPDTFWAEQAQMLDWHTPWTHISETDLRTGAASWFVGAKLNVAVNCIDRHLPERADDIAIIWEGDDPNDSQTFTYQQLKDHVCRFANVLKTRGVTKGDRVCIYMPMIPEAAFAMLACTRIGAIHSVVFGGFSPQALQDRILDSDCQTVITADEGIRGGRPIPLKANTDKALRPMSSISQILHMNS